MSAPEACALKIDFSSPSTAFGVPQRSQMAAKWLAAKKGFSKAIYAFGLHHMWQSQPRIFQNAALERV